MQNIINAFKQIEDLTDREPEIMGELTHAYCMENGISKASTIEEAYQRLNSGENKMLNIGIVGRVKAGKSSLLNAVFFKGEDILPKAATPMTASLTLMTYGNNEASVELFSKSDIADIKKEHDAYLAIKENKLQETLAKVQKNRVLTPQLEEQARKAVEKSMLSQPARPYYELYEGIAQSQLLAQVINSDQSVVQTINADSPQAIAAELNNYVGSQGVNSTITKSAQLMLNMPELRDLRIVDTPGLNDPVASRSQRTLDFMKQCDVIFVVSPCSQFMNEGDIRLMVNAIQEQSISKIYVIASQADMTMISDVADKNGHAFEPSFDSLRRDMELSLAYCLQHSERQVLKQALAGAPVILTSSICFTLERKIANDEPLSENELLVLNNLKATYPDAFSSKEQSLASLHQLAGIGAVQASVSEVREFKDAIIKERQLAFKQDQQASVERYLSYLLKKIPEKQLQFEQTSSLAELQSEAESLAQIRNEISSELNIAFYDSFSQLKKDLRDQFSRLSRNFVSNSGMSGAQQLHNDTHSEPVDVDFLIFFKRRENKTVTEKSIDPSQVRREVQGQFGQFVYRVQNTLDRVLFDWINTAVQSELIALESLDQNWCIEHGLRTRDIEQAVKTSIFELRDQLPQIDFNELDCFKTKVNFTFGEQNQSNRYSFLYSTSVSSMNGVLYGAAAEQFLVKLNELLAWFEQSFNQKCQQYLQELELLSNQIDISKSVFAKLDKKYNIIKQQLTNKEQSLAHYKLCQEQLAQIVAKLKTSEN